MQQIASRSTVVLDEQDTYIRATNLILQGFQQLQWAEAEESLQAIFDKVERAKQEWEASVDALPELICLVDDRGSVIRANRTVETWGLGQVVTVKDRDLHDLIHPGCANPLCYFKRYVRRHITEASEHQPAELEVYDSILLRYLLIQIQPVAARSPFGSSSVVVVQDISERKQAEEALRRRTERLQVVNEVGEAILAACSPDAIAQAALSRIRSLIPFRAARVTLSKPESDECYILAVDSDGGTHLGPGKLLRADAFRGSEERRLERGHVIGDLSKLADLSAVEQQLVLEGTRSYASIPLYAENELIGSLSLGSDHPDAFESEHIEIACQVADWLAIAIRQAQLYAKLNHMNVELQAALEAKEQMIQNVSHDLRSPLSVISGYLDLLTDTEMGPLTAEQDLAVTAMRQQTDHVLFLVTRLITLQTINDKALQKESLDVAGWLRQAVLPWELYTTRRGIQLRLEVPCTLPRVAADPPLLTQVIENLLNNAVKFSPDGGQIRIQVRVTGAQIVVAVADNGMGIAPDKLERVFERFYQVDGGITRRFQGMGIGLALCQAIVEAHGGRIWVESLGEGQGSTFYFALPAADGAEYAALQA